MDRSIIIAFAFVTSNSRYLQSRHYKYRIRSVSKTKRSYSIHSNYINLL
ncbi:hypothetical protein [Leptospira noguchii]|nr:hypothetical protein [Leptospira noguchii]UOG53479.1 hypothetical protein MAL09_04745 [Leptospira noguchii]